MLRSHKSYPVESKFQEPFFETQLSRRKRGDLKKGSQRFHDQTEYPLCDPRQSSRSTLSYFPNRYWREASISFKTGIQKKTLAGFPMEKSPPPPSLFHTSFHESPPCSLSNSLPEVFHWKDQEVKLSPNEKWHQYSFLPSKSGVATIIGRITNHEC